MIRAKKLDKAVDDARRFIEAAESVYVNSEKREYVPGDPWYEGGQYCAAMKRASMDLSKSLAALRKTQ